MDDTVQVNATSVWDERYEKGEHVGTQQTIVDDPIDYTQHKFLYQHSIGLPTTGSLDGWPIEDFARKYLKTPPKRVLAIGSGMAFIEEHLLAAGIVEHIVAYEMSPTAVQAALARVADKPYGARLEMRSGDVLKEDLPDGAFDMVFVQAAIHHFFEIEEMFKLFHRVLRPGGLLWFDEYVGPDHHMYDRHVMDIMNEMNGCLAPQYRQDALAKRERQSVPEPSLDFMMQHDPSEGVHASEILPLTYQYFDVLQRQDYGGAIMRPFFTGILPNFDWADPKDQTIARLIILYEQMLTRTSVIPSYHSIVLARRKDSISLPLPAAEKSRITYADWSMPEAAPSIAPGAGPAAAVSGPKAGIVVRALRKGRRLVRRVVHEIRVT